MTAISVEVLRFLGTRPLGAKLHEIKDVVQGKPWDVVREVARLLQKRLVCRKSNMYFLTYE
jgi:predicted transcriptional regulator